MASATPRTAIKTNGRSGRPSQSQPHHRRPDWAKTERAYHRYIENPTIRQQHNREDHGYDNFTYDPQHLVESLMPYDLMPRLPPLLRKEAKLFVLAFAAVYTAFERIEELDKEASSRADPQTTHTHLLNRRASDDTPTVVGAETPLHSSTIPTAPQPALPTPQTVGSKKPLMQTAPQLPVNMTGLESPPFTPVDSKVANTPVNELLCGPNSMAPADLARVNAELSKSALTIESAALKPAKNEIAWQFYVNQYNAEVEDLKKHAYKRLEGYDRTITRQFFEHLHDDGLRMDQKAALQEFRFWWNDIKGKVGEVKERVMALETKAVGTVSETEAMGKTPFDLSS